MSVPSSCKCFSSQFLNTELLSESTQHPAPEEEIALYETESKSRPTVTKCPRVSALLRVFLQTHLLCSSRYPKEPDSSVVAE